MINPCENMILIDGIIKTVEIHSCQLNGYRDKYNIIYKSARYKSYAYNRNKVIWLTHPEVIAPKDCRLFHQDRELIGISHIAVFRHYLQKYWFIVFTNGTSYSFYNDEIKIVRSCLSDDQAYRIFNYLQDVAAINPLKSEDDGTPLLLRQYQNINFIEDDLAIAPYLNPHTFKPRLSAAPSLIYPFGCNASQQKAVRRAFEQQLSIIQGPPGTGKTQTILNIVANIIRQGETVMVVSNNNSALTNIVEKMERYDIGFITALLGSRENKEKFINSQETSKVIPADINLWHNIEVDNGTCGQRINHLTLALSRVYAKRERLAIARQELDALRIEQKHFGQKSKQNQHISVRKPYSSKQLLNLWNELQAIGERPQYTGLFAKWVNAIRAYLLRRKLRQEFVGDLAHSDIHTLIVVVQHQLYQKQIAELVAEIDELEHFLATNNADQLAQSLQQESMSFLRNVLYHKYGGQHERPIYTMRSMHETMIDEYPVVLSTTFSSRTNFHKDTIFDYVIMDEASQISAETGALALMCARNAVIVGDSMQLPNVVTEEDKIRLQTIATHHKIDNSYNCACSSFLQSVCDVLPRTPQTLLREHYRCHPKIINFCNQKFYGGQLIVMTQDKGEEDVVSAKRTVPGNHARGTMNLREIEVVTREVLPALPYRADEIGIIAPYNGQVDALTRAVDGRIDVATVHKFQGREKDAIILSTVDDIISEFADDPNLLNVAISRAKQKFCLVVSGNEQPKDRNIADLLAYIEYNNCSVTDSNIHSIFDLLYHQYTEARWEYLKGHDRISEYDSENLTYVMLEHILKENPSFSHLGILCHYPLHELIQDVSSLTEEDRTYVVHPNSHVDFIVYSRVSKNPVLAIETDGYEFHKSGTAQAARDEKKNRILSTYNIPLLRLSTIGSNEIQLVEDALRKSL